MTCLAVEPPLALPPPSRLRAVREAVFWGFILSVIVSPAVLSAIILLRG
jgi:hypothetical protein